MKRRIGATKCRNLSASPFTVPHLKAPLSTIPQSDFRHQAEIFQKKFLRREKNLTVKKPIRKFPIGVEIHSAGS
jgi:hypothetical protein